MPFPSGPDELDAAWLERALEGSGVVGAGRGCAIRVDRIGVGYGLDGTIARVAFERASGGPETLVAKWCDASGGRRETAFYRHVAPGLGLDLPVLYGAFEDGERALLLLSDVAPARQGDAVGGATPNESLALCEVAATVHASCWARTDGPAFAPFPPWDPERSGKVDLTTRGIPRFLERWGEQISPAARVAALGLPDVLPDALDGLRAAPRTLIHADLHLDNVLFRPDGTPVVVDWANATRGAAAVDVARMLVEAMTVETRRDVEDALLERHSAALVRRGVRGYGHHDLVADVGRAIVAAFSSAVRWAGGDDLDSGVPRLMSIVSNLVQNTAAAVLDWTERDRIGRAGRSS